MKIKNDKIEREINWLLIRYKKDGRNGNGFVQNLIIDENLFAIEIFDQAITSIVGINYGWHEGEDGKIYDRYGLNYDNLAIVYNSNDFKKLEFYKNNLKKLLSGGTCDPYFYAEYNLFLRKSKIYEVCNYNKKLERKIEEKTI